jgi:hypothetical protein
MKLSNNYSQSLQCTKTRSKTPQQDNQNALDVNNLGQDTTKQVKRNIDVHQITTEWVLVISHNQ